MACCYSDSSTSTASTLPVAELDGYDCQDSNENDNQPMLIRTLSRDLSAEDANSSTDASASFRSFESAEPRATSIRVLNTFFGVFVPVGLSQFSTTIFLRLGYVIGQAGLLEAIAQFLLAYVILGLTVLSICAISTNGAVEGGGAYYMISRALGPEFGGSIGLLFFLANIFSCAVYVSGFVEGVTDAWGSPGGHTQGQPLPIGRWYVYAYGTIVLIICLAVCMIGAQMFAKTSSVILAVVTICILSVLVSVIAVSSREVNIPCANEIAYKGVNHTCGDKLRSNSSNSTPPFYLTYNYTGLSLDTLNDNLLAHYTTDYTTANDLNFFIVFAVLFSGVTGIMNGANMSGELKNPSKSIPKGTLMAVSFTFIVYVVLTIFVAASTPRVLLQNDYNVLKDINIWPPFVYIGIFAATLSAALGNLIGASRVLEALARDDLFWIFTRPARITSKSGNPWMAVIISWLLVQAVLCIGSMNAIAPMTTVFFLMSYASVNIACLALDLTSAPNFRPTFKYFNVWTCVLAMVGCVTMTFLIKAIYAAIAIAIATILIILLYFRGVSTSWGSISQALIFHQVRKYLLLLDNRKDHVKFWRPQMLYMVSNPRQSANIIDFINDMKKSGLYVLGHVKVGKLDDCRKDPALMELKQWQSLIDFLKVKAFVEITLANSVREGLQQLVRISGLGGMKPNTICMGFYDETIPTDTFQSGSKKNIFRFGGVENAETNMAVNYFRLVRSADEARTVNRVEYVNMIRDCVKMRKNVCLFRHFHKLNKSAVFKNKTCVDVWPVNMFQPDKASYMDNCCLFLLQLACVLHMVKGWKQATSLRVFMCHASDEEETKKKERKLAVILNQLRIDADIVTINWSRIVDLRYPSSLRSGAVTETPSLPEDYLKDINMMIQEQSSSSSVVFCYLPLPPATISFSQDYLDQLTLLTDNLPPTVLVHGLNPVTSTTL